RRSPDPGEVPAPLPRRPRWPRIHPRLNRIDSPGPRPGSPPRFWLWRCRARGVANGQGARPVKIRVLLLQLLLLRETMMLQLAIKGGDVVTPQGVIRCDVGISGEKIVVISEASGVIDIQSAERVIDATGRIVMPGGIDPHVHLKHPWMKPDGTTL